MNLSETGLHNDPTAQPPTPAWLRPQRWTAFVIAGAYFVPAAWAVIIAGDSAGRDDWDFAATALELVASGRYRLSDFPSMTLLSHIAWGAAFVAALGPSMMSLRWATVATTLLGAVILYRLARRHHSPPALAGLLMAAYLFHPLAFYLSSTFYTDSFGCTMLVITIDVIDRLGALSRRRDTVFVALVIAIAYLGRQTAAIGGIAYLVVAVAASHALGRRLRAVSVACLAALPIAAHAWFMASVHGLPLGYQKAFLTPDIFLNPKLLVAKTIQCLFSAAWHTAPLGIGLGCAAGPVARWWMCAAFFGVASAVSATSFKPIVLQTHREDMLHDAFLGDLPAVEGTRAAVASWQPHLGALHWDWFNGMMAALAAASLIGWWFWLRDCDLQLQSRPIGWIRANRTVAVALLSWLGNFLLLLLVWDLFDRYFLPLFVNTLILVALLPQGRRQPLGWAWTLTVVMAVVAVLGSLEAKRFQRAIHDATVELVASGIPPQQIDGGPEIWGRFVYRPRLTAALDRNRRLQDFSRQQRRAWLSDDAPKHYLFVTSPRATDRILRTIWVRGWFREIRFHLVERRTFAPKPEAEKGKGIASPNPGDEATTRVRI